MSDMSIQTIIHSHEKRSVLWDILSIFLLIICGIFLTVFSHIQVHASELQSEESQLETATESSADVTSAVEGDVVTIYLGGSDTREETLSDQTRNDVNIIARVNTATHEVLLVFTPRDYYVPLSISNGVPDKLTHAGIYGVQVSVDTLAMLYDIDIDYYFHINFTGFVDIIDALGGIEVESEYEFEAGGYHFTEGINQLDGEAALVFCRERYAFPTGDRQRGRNQLAVIEAIIEKATSPSILNSLPSILESAKGCVDTNIPYDFMLKLILEQLAGNADWNITTYSVDGTGDSQIPYSMNTYAYVMIPDTSTVEHAKELFREIAGE